MNLLVQQIQKRLVQCFEQVKPVELNEPMRDGLTRKAKPAEIRRAIQTGRPVPFKRLTRQIDITEATP